MSATCHLPWAQAFVNANGTISPCCAPLELGHVQEVRINEAFSGPQYGDLRNALGNNCSTPLTSYCDNCYLRKKHTEAQYNFEQAYSLGWVNMDEALENLKKDHFKFVENYRKIRHAYLTGEPNLPHAYPLRIEIQLGEHCDLRCIMCWQDHKRPMALDRDTIESISELFPYVVDVVFTGGEPTIFKSFWELIERFKALKIPQARLQILTHGLHLAENLHRFEGIESLGFCINVDGPTAETYERIRNRGKWDKLCQNLSATAKACDSHPNWGMNFTFLLMRSNIELIKKSFEMCNEYRAGWSCGLIAGEYTPIMQCRAYFEENIFRFSHLGFDKATIQKILDEAIHDAAVLEAPDAAESAIAALRATQQQVSDTQQIMVPEETANRLLRETDNRKLSAAIQDLVSQTMSQNTKQVEPLSAAQGEKSRAETFGDSLSGVKSQVAIAKNLMQAQRLNEALTLFRRADFVYSRSNSITFPEQAELQLNFARCEIASGLGEGIVRLQQLADTSRSEFGISNSRTAEIELELGKALIADSRLDEARGPLRSAFETFVRLYGNQDFSSFMSVAADTYARTLEDTDPHAAIPLLARALKIYDDHYGVNSSLSQDVAARMALALENTGDGEESSAIKEKYGIIDEIPYQQPIIRGLVSLKLYP